MTTCYIDTFLSQIIDIGKKSYLELSYRCSFYLCFLWNVSYFHLGRWDFMWIDFIRHLIFLLCRVNLQSFTRPGGRFASIPMIPSILSSCTVSVFLYALNVMEIFLLFFLSSSCTLSLAVKVDQDFWLAATWLSSKG